MRTQLKAPVILHIRYLQRSCFIFFCSIIIAMCTYVERVFMFVCVCVLRSTCKLSIILTGIKLCKYCNCTKDSNRFWLFSVCGESWIAKVLMYLTNTALLFLLSSQNVTNYYLGSTVTYLSLFDIMPCSCFYMSLPGLFLPPDVLAKHEFYFRYNLQYSVVHNL